MSKIENEANTFAAELLIPDELISDNPELTAEQVARLAGYNAAIMKFKIHKHDIIIHEDKKI